jgi:hypothetical protein
MVGPFDSKTLAPAPTEPRAVQHIREKVEQRTRNVRPQPSGRARRTKCSA